jgi:hypothetical protein
MERYTQEAAAIHSEKAVNIVSIDVVHTYWDTCIIQQLA